MQQMQLPVGAGWSMLHSLSAGHHNGAPFPPAYPAFQSTSPMPGYPSFYPPPLHALPPHHQLAYPPPPLTYQQQPPPSSSPVSALSASLSAVRPPSMPAPPGLQQQQQQQQQPQPSASVYTSQPQSQQASYANFTSPSTEPYLSSTPVSATAAALYQQPTHLPHPPLQQTKQQQSVASSPSAYSASSLSSSTSTPTAPSSRITSVMTHTAGIVSSSSSSIGSAGSSDKKRKRKRGGQARASTGASSRRLSGSGGGDSESSDGLDLDDDDKEEKTDSESDDVGGIVTDTLQQLNDPSVVIGKGPAGSAGGLGQYELELLQREVDELHDEAMAERTRADEVEDRHIRLLQKGRQLAAKCQQLDAALQHAMAAGSGPDQGDNQVLRWNGMLAALYAEMKAILGDLIDSSSNEQEAALHTARSSAPASSVAHARLSRFLSKSAGERFCKPCRLITTLSKRPFRVLLVDVQRQYTMSKKETRRMTKEEKERLVSVPLRIMGTPNRNNLYFVAKDVCILIHTRKGNVAKSIGQFSEKQKARMPVLCVRSNGTVSTHILTVLTVEGVQRLLGASRSMLAPQVLTWILQQVDTICGDNPPEPSPTVTAAVTPTARNSSSPSSSSHSASPPTANSAAAAAAAAGGGGVAAQSASSSSPSSASSSSSSGS